MTDYEYAILENFARLNDGLDKIIELLRPDHSVEERKTGKWEYDTSSCGAVAFIYRKCSECGYENMGIGSKYCPNCGARMIATKGGPDYETN